MEDTNSNIVDIKSSSTIRTKNIHNPFITYLNINSLRNNLRCIVSKILPEILTISETKIDNSFPDAQFFIDGYQNPSKSRKDRTQNGGGLIIFMKKGIPYRRLTEI